MVTSNCSAHLLSVLVWEHFATKCVTLLISIPVIRVIFLIIILTRIFEQVSSLGEHDESLSLIDIIFIRHFFFIQYCIYLLSWNSSF